MAEISIKYTPGKRCEGKVAVVTGGVQGIGKACCIRLAEQGAKVAVTGRKESLGKEVVDEIKSFGGVAKFWQLEVTNEDNVKKVFGEIAAEFGPITVLVNNAGVTGVNKPPHEITSEEWDFVMNVNVKGLFFCTKHGIPYMKKAGVGSIIHMSSMYGLISAADLPPYHASKGAVTLMAKTDALFYAPDNIRVNSVHPGYIYTPLLEGFAKGYGDKWEEEFKSRQPLAQIGQPDDIAYGVVFLASDESKFMTGAELVIDGGYTTR
mmetsp:Transcript_35063/g.58647  ORF Transcript_35063/g.58647 Transcript_35063/m.58647 type:complete len:264 (-) Transcript_35063:309-1100(-)|eukprot:CAMPEP_0184672276 /NCGR_PEP_ID=MMETSP0308-20130426/86005_1 /TAXON_ID=38269 /ORGANISM="Gloeochaete witrockiana, Strain SAG 46.84" /LENGTH=263 /DNA_ID=CAMNT_0027119573 /DNA_START=600 /DNA_END=1391 /DNA_ORIENTATION=+